MQWSYLINICGSLTGMVSSSKSPESGTTLAFPVDEETKSTDTFQSSEQPTDLQNTEEYSTFQSSVEYTRLPSSEESTTIQNLEEATFITANTNEELEFTTEYIENPTKKSQEELTSQTKLHEESGSALPVINETSADGNKGTEKTTQHFSTTDDYKRQTTLPMDSKTSEYIYYFITNAAGEFVRVQGSTKKPGEGFGKNSWNVKGIIREPHPMFNPGNTYINHFLSCMMCVYACLTKFNMINYVN